MLSFPSSGASAVPSKSYDMSIVRNNLYCLLSGVDSFASELSHDQRGNTNKDCETRQTESIVERKGQCSLRLSEPAWVRQKCQLSWLFSAAHRDQWHWASCSNCVLLRRTCLLQPYGTVQLHWTQTRKFKQVIDFLQDSTPGLATIKELVSILSSSTSMILAQHVICDLWRFVWNFFKLPFKFLVVSLLYLTV